MKKAYNLLFIINILLGMFIFINYFFLYNYSKFSIIFTVILCLIYLVCTIIYNGKKSKRVEIVDIVFMTISLILIMTLLVLSIVFQLSVLDMYALLYFDILILIPHVLIIIYNLLR